MQIQLQAFVWVAAPTTPSLADKECQRLYFKDEVLKKNNTSWFVLLFYLFACLFFKEMYKSNRQRFYRLFKWQYF